MLENIIHRDATTTSATTTTTTTALWDAIENENGDIDSIHEQQQQEQQQIIMKTKLLEQGKRVRQILQQQFDCSNPPLSTTTTTTTTKSQHDMIEYYSSSQSMYHPSSYTKRNHQRGFSNWILKQYIMIGQYPGQTPEKDGPSLSSVKRHIESLLFATADDDDDDDVHVHANDNDDNNKNNNNHHHDIIISTKKNIGFLFCSLQDEIPSQTDYTSWKKQKNPGRIYLSWESGRREFPHYFGHYEPIVMDVFLKKKKQQQQQQQQSISTMRNNRNRKMMIIKKKKKKKKDLSRNHEDNAHYDDDNFASSSSSSPSFLHMPIIDLSTPNSSSLYQTLSTLLQTLEDHHQLNSNSNSNNDHHHNAIYIHCWGGRGRAGLIGSCLLSILFPELSAEYILDWIQRGYNTRLGSEYMPVGLRKSPQTYTQREFVCNFVKEMQMMTMMMMDTDT